MSSMIIDSRVSLSIDRNVFDMKKLKIFDKCFEEPRGLQMVPKMKGFVFFNRISTQRGSVSSFSRLGLLAKSIPSLMYNPALPPSPLFQPRLMKLYLRISKKALWKSSLIEVFEKLNMSKLYDNKISRSSSVFPYKPLIFWWQSLM